MITYESQYYGISELGATLTHHGIKGQKWGIRRYQNPDGTLTEAGKRRYFTESGTLNKKGVKQYRKEYKKLQKLQDRANIDLQRQKAEKYNRRSSTAALVALGAAGASAGAANLKGAIQSKRDSILSKGVREAAKLDKDRYYGNLAAELATKMTNEDAAAGWWKSGLTQYVEAGAQKDRNYRAGMEEISKLNKIGSVRQGVAVGAAAVASVSAGVAVYSKIKAHAATKLTTELGHEKAVQDAKRQVEQMERMFGDVNLSDLQKRKAW